MPPDSLLLLVQGDSPAAHPGILDGYQRLVADGTLAHVEGHGFLGPQGAAAGQRFWTGIAERARATAATMLVVEYYHEPGLPDPRPGLDVLRAASPDLFVVATMGDAFHNGWLGRLNVPTCFMQLAEAADLVMPSGMGVMGDHLAAATHAPVAMYPTSLCQVRFAPPDPRDLAGRSPFDVVHIGSRNIARNPLRGYHRAGRRRDAMVRALAERFEARFGLYGRGWEGRSGAQGPVPYAEQAAAARQGTVVVGGAPFTDARYSTSDRTFIQVGSGVPFVAVPVEGMATMLRPGEHWLPARHEDVVDVVEEVLSWDEDRRIEFGVRAAAHVHANHTQAARAATVVENVRRLRSAQPGQPVVPHLPWLLPEVDPAQEARHATRNWPLPAS